MRHFRGILAAITLTVVLCTAQASALEYDFSGPVSNDYYPSTGYEDVYGSAYKYGGVNVVDYQHQPELPGYHFSVQIQPPMTSTGSSAPSYDGSFLPDGGYDWPSSVQTPFTPASSVVRSDGSIGTLKISSLGINFKAYEGETTSSMKKGVGHFTATSAWNGNIGLCGHNRGSSHNIGSIKNLSIGDAIKYTTSLGTRTYEVTFVGKIANTDWSYLNATSDNRITLITCAANEPDYRWCVQAVEK